MPVVLYGCETWSLTWREERRLRVFENRVLKRIFGPKKDEVTGEYRTLHNEELSDLHSASSIVRVIKLRRMRWAGHVALLGEGSLMERDNLKDPDIDWLIILRWIFRKWDVEGWTGLMWLRMRQVMGTCNCGNETSCSIKCGKFIE